MFAKVKTVLDRPEIKIAQDALGAVALLVILFAGLSLPNLM